MTTYKKWRPSGRKTGKRENPLRSVALTHAARGGYALNGSPASSRRKHDHVIVVPRSAHAARDVAQRPRRLAAGSDLLQLGIGEEPDIPAIGGPKRICRVLGARHGFGLERVQGAATKAGAYRLH